MVGLATCEVLEVVAPPFPKWYVEAPVDGTEATQLMDEVRTALLDYPSPEAIVELYHWCVAITVTEHHHLARIANHLVAKGFRFCIDNFALYTNYPDLKHIAVLGRD